MAHRIYRLSISPADAPEVRRDIDIDGRSSLADLHLALHRIIEISDGDDHLYAFFLSGDFWDKETEYDDPRTEGRRADKALLFRLGLSVDQRIAYLFDFGAELRYLVRVVAIREADAPLPAVLLVESAGDLAHRLKVEPDDGADDEPSPRFAALVPLAEAVIAESDAFQPFRDDEDESDDPTPDLSEAGKSALRKLADAALALASAVNGELELLAALDVRFHDDALIVLLLGLPLELSTAGETELALRVAQAFEFSAPDDLAGDIAVIYARAGRRDEALARLALNLEQAGNPFIAEAKAGDTYRALGEDDAAEVYYRRSLAEAKSNSDRSEAVLRITSLLFDTGREADAAAFVAEERARRAAARTVTRPVSVGRNDPCPCGSGKKYKKCHGE